MPPNGRSLDDLPLAAYTTGVDPGELDEPEEPALAAPVSGGDALASPFAPAEGAPLDMGAAAPEPDRPPFGEVLRNPRAHVRDPRLLLGGVVAVGVVLLAFSLLTGGGAPPTEAATATPTPAPQPTTLIASGDATLVLEGAAAGTFTLAGVPGRHVDGQSISASWADSLQNVLSLSGPIDRGTRTTDARLTLSITVILDGQTVTFTSIAGECTIGMASLAGKVSGSFTCHRLRSADGKLVVEASGTYRT